MACVTDANFGIDLHEGSLVERAFHLSSDWIVTDVILNEIEVEGRLAPNALLEKGIVAVSHSGDLLTRIPELALKYPATSPEDLSALVQAREDGLILVTGDRALRVAADAEGVEVHGTLWVLDRMIDEDVISPRVATESLHAMLRSDRRLPTGEVTKRLRAWT